MGSPRAAGAGVAAAGGAAARELCGFAACQQLQVCRMRNEGVPARGEQIVGFWRQEMAFR